MGLPAGRHRARDDGRTDQSVLPEGAGMSRAIYWRCFHCGEAFTKAQATNAMEHFGPDCSAKPVCLMRLPGENNLLRALRQAHEELHKYRTEDTELHRALHAMSADHDAALRREEEIGFAKGLLYTSRAV